MTIRFIKQWNGNAPDSIVTLDGAEETRLINLGFAVSDLDGPQGARLVSSETNDLTGGIEILIGGIPKEVGPMRLQEYLATGLRQYFYVPVDCAVVEIEGIAAGGGGGGGHNGAGGGGGGGGGGYKLNRKAYAVTPGETLTVDVPTGGAGGAIGVNGSGPVGPSGAVDSGLRVTGSVSGLIILVYGGAGGVAGSVGAGGSGGAGSAARYVSGGTGNTGGGGIGGDAMSFDTVDGCPGASGGGGTLSTAGAQTGGRGGRLQDMTASGSGGSAAAASQGVGGGGAGGFPKAGTAGGNGGAASVAGSPSTAPGGGGGGGGSLAAGGKGGDGFLRVIY